MGLIADAVATLLPWSAPRNAAANSEAPSLVSLWQDGQAQRTQDTRAYVRAYESNDLFYALSETIAQQAGEPRLIGRKYTGGGKNRDVARAKINLLRQSGMPEAMLGQALELRNLSQDMPDTPASRLANNPNPRSTKSDFWAAIVLDYVLAGNAYVWMSGRKHSPRNGRPPEELWRLRPDRMSVVPDRDNIIAGYEYRLGGEVYFLPDEDVIHFRKRSLSSDFYGDPITKSLGGRLDLDNAMRLFPTAYFNNAGVPSGFLATKTKLTKESRDELRDRWRQQSGGPAGWHELMVLDGTDATFTSATTALGTRGLIVPELNAIGEARICAAFNVPPSIVGALVGLEKSSYANNRVDWQIFWEVCLIPLFGYLDDQLTMRLLPTFGRTVDELIFDMGDVKALQDDVDALMDRARKNLDAGMWTIEEARLMTGLDPTPADGEHILLPIRSTLVPTPLEDYGPERPPPIAPPAADPSVAARIQALIREEAWFTKPAPAAALPTRTGGRLPRRLDRAARALYNAGQVIRDQHPRISEAQIAARLSISLSTWNRYRATFDDEDEDAT